MVDILNDDFPLIDASGCRPLRLYSASSFEVDEVPRQLQRGGIEYDFSDLPPDRVTADVRTGSGFSIR